MATNIESARPTKREVQGARGERFTITMNRNGILVRPKGSSKVYGPVTWGVITDRAMKLGERGSA